MSNKIIVINESLFQSIAKDVVSLLVLLAAIGIGIWTQSSAMQWAGALMLFIYLFARGAPGVKSFTSIDEAHRYLDEIAITRGEI